MISEQIKVLHVIGSLKRGGRERQLCTIVSNLNSGNWEQRIICLNRTVADYVDEHNLHKQVKYLSSQRKIGRLVEIIGIFKDQKPDVVYAWGSDEYLYVRAAHLVGRTFVPINGSVRHGIVSSKIGHYLRMLVLWFSPIVIANSMAGLMVNRLKLCPNRRILYNGIDPKFAKNDPAKTDRIRKDLGIDQDTLVFISVSNFVPYKDYFTVLDALKKLADDHSNVSFFYIALGSGPLLEQVTEKSRLLNLHSRIRFPGSVTNVEDYLGIADTFIHSSKGEGCSNAILEAMHAGLPVVASDTGGTSEILDDTYSMLFQYKNAESLYRCLRCIIFERDYRRMGRRAREAAKRSFSVERMIQDYQNIMGDIFMRNRNHWSRSK